MSDKNNLFMKKKLKIPFIITSFFQNNLLLIFIF
jgi:hypothetical protein